MHRGAHAALELVVVVGVEEVVLAVVLVVHHRLHAAESSLEQRVLGRALLRAGAVGIAAPHDPRAGQISLLAPSALVDERLQAGAVCARPGAEDAVAGTALGVRARDPGCREALHVRRVRRGQGIVALGLVKPGDGADRGVEQGDLGREGIAEEPRDPQRHVDPRAVQEIEREDFESGDPPRARIPGRAHAEKRQGLGDVVAAGAHVRRAPRGRAPCAAATPRAPGDDVPAAARPTSSRAAMRPGSERSGCRWSRSCDRSAERRDGPGSGRLRGRVRGSDRRAR